MQCRQYAQCIEGAAISGPTHTTHCHVKHSVTVSGVFHLVSFHDVAHFMLHNISQRMCIKKHRRIAGGAQRNCEINRDLCEKPQYMPGMAPHLSASLETTIMSVEAYCSPQDTTNVS